ncbi:MAG: peroxidase [Vulcanimicrobiaceae bacterium]
MANGVLERSDVQGLVASGYVHLACSAYVLLRFEGDGAGRGAWLETLARDVTSADKKGADGSLNIAFTHAGLTKLGLDPTSLGFPLAFCDGMSSARRAKILSDDHERWTWGASARTGAAAAAGKNERGVDVLVLVYAPTEAALNDRLASLLSGAAACGAIPVVEPLCARLHADRNEHFGFSDGIAQPVLASLADAADRARAGNVVADGEFVLGYRNEYGYVAETPRLGDAGELGKNGSYLVFRQIRQDVAKFWTWIDDAAGGDCVRREWLAAKMVGRWKSGAPLATFPDGDPDPTQERTPGDDFGYRDDSLGLGCPIGAHVRRTNPRDGLTTSADGDESYRRTKRHRILRRGRSYGERLADPRSDDGTSRGLHFICLCADLERQFEFVQQTWVNNPLFGNLVGEVDPLVGDQAGGDAVLTIPREPARLRLVELPSFVDVVGGGYFFLPSLRALRWIAALTSAR